MERFWTISSQSSGPACSSAVISRLPLLRVIILSLLIPSPLPKPTLKLDTSSDRTTSTLIAEAQGKPGSSKGGFSFGPPIRALELSPPSVALWLGRPSGRNRLTRLRQGLLRHCQRACSSASRGTNKNGCLPGNIPKILAPSRAGIIVNLARRGHSRVRFLLQQKKSERCDRRRCHGRADDPPRQTPTEELKR